MATQKVCTKMMDFREAKACLDEYCISLANICGMIKPVIAKGELGQAIEKINNRLIERLSEEIKEAVILSTMIHEDMATITETLVDFPGELADLFEALNQLRLAIDKAIQMREEHIRRAEAATKEKEGESGVSDSIR